ncbi:hypothetical protein SELMODRAFT_442294 [Selaginella moellendorffii]|uniref:Uncharacterized protein n=1 Tax=Selaginella moellendorffii TaxID=88036 RepID=D8RSB3_SELML|nr:uncharacterized protein LOC9656673 [Selaginella moellendorffii]EFJ25036.1 hypothetical protein SELMODRAFT_442294 [Selaginella moellendorffii]|eukprot:XP_002974081.1 uncharacterized protein LOC9656673 [Selaginella moellendorffii]
MANRSDDQHGEVENAPPAEPNDEEDSLLMRVNAYLGDAPPGPDPAEVEDAESSPVWLAVEESIRQHTRPALEEAVKQARAEASAQATRELRMELQALAQDSSARMERFKAELDQERARVAELREELAIAKAQAVESKIKAKLMLDFALNERLFI